MVAPPQPSAPLNAPPAAIRAYVCWSAVLIISLVMMLINLLLSGNPAGAIAIGLAAGAHAGSRVLRNRARYGRPLATTFGAILIVLQLATLALVLAVSGALGFFAVLLSIIVGLLIIGLSAAGIFLMFQREVTEFLADR